MKGLIIKDFRMLGQQKNLFVIYLVMAIVLGFSMDGTFLVTYFPMIGFFLVLSTISLDNFDNGMAFLMTLPTSGKLYALEKYVIGSVIAIGTWAFATVLQFGMFFIKKEAFVTSEVLSMDLAIIPILLLAIAIMIPIDIKFGTEKGRLVMFVIAGIFFMIFLGGKSILNCIKEQKGVDIQAMVKGIEAAPFATIIAGALLIVSLLLVGSVMLTIRIMEKREY
ncbi:MAG: ABC-2 transporter permease [Lachnospiraceae bacterium]|nr:ABC-2 transporter permease [Lachnospiraceae bacterium]